jgi:hypothetical protein
MTMNSKENTMDLIANQRHSCSGALLREDSTYQIQGCIHRQKYTSRTPTLLLFEKNEYFLSAK